MALGYRGNPSWRDMSEYLVHFCGSREALVAIMLDGEVEGRNPFGWAREFETERDAARQRGEPLRTYPTQKSVCLSEVPVDLLDRLVHRRGHWGLGFTRQGILSDDGAPVWYAELDKPVAAALARLQSSITTSDQRRDWYTVAPFVDKVGEFPNGATYRFEWEREWRVSRRIELGVDHPVFLFAPETEHGRLKSQLNAGVVAASPGGIPPMLDPTWDESKLQASLSKYML